MDSLYTAIAHASGGGRDGHVLSEDNQIDMDTRPPKELGGSGEGTNPEQLFAVAYAACFLSALHGVGKRMGVDTTGAQVSASVALGKTSDIAYGIAVDLDIYAPNVPADQRQQLADGAHQVCPYSNATRGNVDVKLTLVD
ncbi:MAG TPA: organic hydroperoxide resistance protein [Galbitalea sp.]|jgi:Ohr subfamily peroxiredoxin